MNDNERILILTEKGREELKAHKALKLEERSLLVMIDCSTTVQQLLHKARGYPHAEQIIEHLIKEDYLAVTTEVPKLETREAVQCEFKQAITAILGPGADDVLKKIASSPIDKQALLIAIKQIKQMVYLTIDEKKAVLLEEALKKIVETKLK